MPMFEEKPENSVSYSIHQRALNLPSYFDMTEEDIEKVAEVVRSTLNL